MPLYEYRCQTCGERFELLQRMGASREGVRCPRCGGEEVVRLLSTFASTSTATASCGAPAASCGSFG